MSSSPRSPSPYTPVTNAAPSRPHHSAHKHSPSTLLEDEKAALAAQQAAPRHSPFLSPSHQFRHSIPTPLSASLSNVPLSSRPPVNPLRSPHHLAASPFSMSIRNSSSSTYVRPRSIRIANLLKPWIPIILYAISSLGFLVAISLWKEEVFQGLDQLSHWLQSDEYFGYAVIFFLIFLTCFPPLPLYSTLIILSGYTFGAWTGAIISYGASLLGALAVFIISRAFFRDAISRWLSCTMTIKRVVRAIEKRPKLLFLIRLAPYPYNVMNCLLAASPTLTLRTYTICTSMSLFKLIIHTSIGSSIHSFAEYHVTKPGKSEEDENAHALRHYSTIVGIALCVGIFVYLSYIARRAVDDELEDDATATGEETTAFLSAEDGEEEETMMESPLHGRPGSLSMSRPSFHAHNETSSPTTDDRFLNLGREEARIGL